jgi:hypothetical protein
MARQPKKSPRSKALSTHGYMSNRNVGLGLGSGKTTMASSYPSVPVALGTSITYPFDPEKAKITAERASTGPYNGTVTSDGSVPDWDLDRANQDLARTGIEKPRTGANRPSAKRMRRKNTSI